jgi:hypothetical protein
MVVSTGSVYFQNSKALKPVMLTLLGTSIPFFQPDNLSVKLAKKSGVDFFLYRLSNPKYVCWDGMAEPSAKTRGKIFDGIPTSLAVLSVKAFPVTAKRNSCVVFLADLVRGESLQVLT